MKTGHFYFGRNRTFLFWLDMDENCSPPDYWQPTSTIGAPSGRFQHTAVWTGTEMIIWGGVYGYPPTSIWNTGSRYNPITDSWTPTSTTGAPSARSGHKAVWTGSQMIIWGGGDLSGNPFDTGGKYNPETDSWTPTSTTGAPSARYRHTAIWTGTEMIIWGGSNGGSSVLNTGARYNPTDDTWTLISNTNAPAARADFGSVWTGAEMIVWGGWIPCYTGCTYLTSGGKYNPLTDTWQNISIVNAPPGTREPSAIWTGKEMIVWGGADNPAYENFGGKYNPSTNTWSPTSMINAPSGRAAHTAVWTDTEMIVWGGTQGHDPYLNTGGIYDPVTNSWSSTSLTNAPAGKGWHTAVWTGVEMIIWGGLGGSNNNTTYNTGGRYTP